MLTVTIFREAVDDIRRHQRDKEVNSQKYRRMVRGRETSELVPSSKLRVGDLVSIYELGICKRHMSQELYCLGNLNLLESIEFSYYISVC